MSEYIIPAGYGEAEYIDKKSRFIGQVQHAESVSEALAFVEGRPRPLALYLFTRSREAKRAVLGRCRFGGGCVNDTLMHLTAASLPFGGVGESGMGAYHGRWGFEEFSHLEGILHRGGALEPPVRYRPWTPLKQAVMRRLLR